MRCWLFGHEFVPRFRSEGFNSETMLIIDYLYCVKCGKTTNEGASND